MSRATRRALAEGIGTYFLVLIGPGAMMVNESTGGVIGHAGVALAFGFVVLAMIYAIGHLSGAHINPAVTIAFWSVGRFPRPDVVRYVLAQVAGATAAAASLAFIVESDAGSGATVPAIPVGPALALEWLLSFALMFVIMAVATDDRVADGFAGVAVGLTVGFCAMMGGPLTGASMNPARSFGPAVAGGIWEAHWIYWVAPITGMIAGARVYEVLRPAGISETARPLGVQGPIDTELGGEALK
ncbi:MAG: MIP family channel protein [Gemmatimonadota bacterium]